MVLNLCIAWEDNFYIINDIETFSAENCSCSMRGRRDSRALRQGAWCNPVIPIVFRAFLQVARTLCFWYISMPK